MSFCCRVLTATGILFLMVAMSLVIPALMLGAVWRVYG